MEQRSGTLDALLTEEREFAPSAEFTRNATMSDASVYDRADDDFEAFWAEAAEELDWFKPWDHVLEWNAPWSKWFIGGELNVSYNCVDRHAASWRKTKAAIIWEGEPGDERVLTYRGSLSRGEPGGGGPPLTGCAERRPRRHLHAHDPELPIAMLACARLGATHSVVFGGFSPESLRDRINDCEAKLVITADAGYRRGGIVPLKDNVDAALDGAPSVERVLVVRRVGRERASGRDAAQTATSGGMTCSLQHEGAVVEPEHVDAEHPLVHPLHLRHDGQAKGRAPYNRRLPHWDHADHQVDLRPEG